MVTALSNRVGLPNKSDKFLWHGVGGNWLARAGGHSSHLFETPPPSLQGSPSRLRQRGGGGGLAYPNIFGSK